MGVDHSCVHRVAVHLMILIFHCLDRSVVWGQVEIKIEFLFVKKASSFVVRAPSRARLANGDMIIVANVGTPSPSVAVGVVPVS